MKKDRFIIKSRDYLNLMTEASIFIDRETGVNYLFVHTGSAGGMTPLLDAEGKPVISPIESANKDGYQK